MDEISLDEICHLLRALSQLGPALLESLQSEQRGEVRCSGWSLEGPLGGVQRETGMEDQSRSCWMIRDDVTIPGH